MALRPRDLARLPLPSTYVAALTPAARGMILPCRSIPGEANIVSRGGGEGQAPPPFPFARASPAAASRFPPQAPPYGGSVPPGTRPGGRATSPGYGAAAPAGGGAQPDFARRRPARHVVAPILPGAPGRLVPLRPRTIADTLDLSFLAVRRGGAVVAVIVMAILLPEQMLRDALTLRATGPMLADPSDLGAAFAGFGWTLLSAAIGIYLGLVISAAIVAVLSAHDRDASLGVWAALRIGFLRSGATLGATVLAAIGVVPLLLFSFFIGLMFALIVPVVGFVIMLPLLVFVPLLGFLISYLLVAVAVEEGLGPWKTLVRTLSLLRRGFWRSMLITLLLGILVFAVAAALFAAGMLIAVTMGDLDWILQVIGGGILAAISTPLFAAAGLVLHRDLRIIGEAYDLRVRARVLAGAA